jgi:hypothetical protein
MSRQLLEDYARLLTTDVTACASLFDEDADYITRVGGKPVRLTGRLRILNFLSREPSNRTLRVVSHTQEGSKHIGRMIIEQPGSAPVEQTVRYAVEGGLIRIFRITEESEVEKE